MLEDTCCNATQRSVLKIVEGFYTQYSVMLTSNDENVPLQLALRAGNEKEEGETADTVGCCSLRVEHIKLYPKMDEQEYVVEFDFLGKDSIRYYNKIPVEKRVRKERKTEGLEHRGVGRYIKAQNNDFMGYYKGCTGFVIDRISC